jgi:hypothetical protein
VALGKIEVCHIKKKRILIRTTWRSFCKTSSEALVLTSDDRVDGTRVIGGN